MHLCWYQSNKIHVFIFKLMPDALDRQKCFKRISGYTHTQFVKETRVVLLHSTRSFVIASNPYISQRCIKAGTETILYYSTKKSQDWSQISSVWEQLGSREAQWASDSSIQTHVIDGFGPSGRKACWSARYAYKANPANMISFRNCGPGQLHNCIISSLKPQRWLDQLWKRKSFTCSPQQPTAFRMEALWMTRYSIPAFTALRTRSLWVVALKCRKKNFNWLLTKKHREYDTKMRNGYGSRA